MIYAKVLMGLSPTLKEVLGGVQAALIYLRRVHRFCRDSKGYGVRYVLVHFSKILGTRLSIFV
jgi:hypothetical protein